MEKNENVMEALNEAEPETMLLGSEQELRIADVMGMVLAQQCMVDDIVVSVANGQLTIYDKTADKQLSGDAAYDYYLYCVRGLIPVTQEAREVEEFFAKEFGTTGGLCE